MLSMEASGSAEHEQSGRQVKIQLSTKQARFALPEDNGPILVNTNLDRKGLSILVNHLLGHKEPAQRIPFEFLINGAIIRSSLDDFINTNGISTETVLHVEYIPAFVSPKYVASFHHNKPVSSIDVNVAANSKQSQPHILSSSYDGCVRVYNTSSQVVAASTYHGDLRYVEAIKVARFVSSERIASAGFRCIISLWQFKEPSTVVSQDSSISHEADLHYHKQMVLGMDVQASEQRLLSASADHTIALWNPDPATAPPYTSNSASTPAASSAKRQKKSSTASLPQIAPLAVYQAHTFHVTGVLFSPHAANQAYSISADNTLKTWSLETTAVLDNRPLADPLYSLTAITNMHLLAAGSSKGDITLLDPRTSTSTVRVSSVRQAHANGFVTSLSNDPSSEYRFVSGGFDGLVKVWDIRSLGSPISVIGEKGGDKGRKVFSVKWDAELGILSGGEDGQVRIHK